MLQIAMLHVDMSTFVCSPGSYGQIQNTKTIGNAHDDMMACTCAHDWEWARGSCASSDLRCHILELR